MFETLHLHQQIKITTMSVKTRARRYNVASYSQEQRDQLVQHFVARTQPQRRLFLGKTSDFKDKEEQRYNEKMLKAYKKGAVVFYPGEKMPREIMTMKFDKEKGKKVPVGTGVYEDVLKPHPVKQIYLFD